MWPLYSPDANPLDFTFWPRIEGKACRVHHPNLNALKAAVREKWEVMSKCKIRAECGTFRRWLEAINEANGGYIEI